MFLKPFTMEEAQQTPHIVFLPSPGMGHLIPLVAFAKRLVHLHDFSVTFTIPNIGSSPKAQKAVFDALPKRINSIFLPPVNLDDLDEDVKIETRICLTLFRSIPAFRETLKNLITTTRLVALVIDPFGTDALDVAREFNVLPYIFIPTTAMMVSWLFLLPKLDAIYSCEYRDLREPVSIPGCLPIHGRDFLEPAQDRTDEAYKLLLYHSKRYKLAEGIMLNTFMDLEPRAIKVLKEGEFPGIPPVYPVGPLIQNGSSDGASESECLKWLDDQPHGSVLFVCFGSGGALSFEQMNEMASGLELSEQRFLWVVRSPSQIGMGTAYFSDQSIEDPFPFMPKGFLERTKGRGLVVPSWAPQTQVLSHVSTGGFLTHCGWNSTLESLVNGVPLIAWPLYAEQKMNAVMLVEDIKVALRPKVGEDGVIRRQEIGTVVKSLMEGEEGKKVRYKIRELKDAAAKVLREDGSSTKSLLEVTHKWKTYMRIL
ncbi:hydroquinone glucosyltransferase-like [Telopea speciosissima]|uniref:hydroquinone glucosyltransferase-like n=1 Tax=Telopea speciosissima TaxID=54955 RepID=UPI001CC76026|nr:hydroquinone glucosyltransferase-like [Telopea speciosissima]